MLLVLLYTVVRELIEEFWIQGDLRRPFEHGYHTSLSIANLCKVSTSHIRKAGRKVKIKRLIAVLTRSSKVNVF